MLQKLKSFGVMKGAGIAAVFLAALGAQPSDNTFSCQSTDGHRRFCRADTSQGPVRMSRQLGDVRCTEGQTWGVQQDGVWVDRGCRAEFAIALPPPPPPAIRARIDQGTVVAVRTNERISAARADGRIFTGTVDQDVMGTRGQLAIPRGSNVELVVRVAHDDDLILDLESVTVDGQRYAVNADANRVDAGGKDTVGANERTGRYVGGGAILGAILGAAVGGGKGAAIGAAAGAGAGATAQIVTAGKEVRIPSESLLTFRIDRSLVVGAQDDGYDRDGGHYHRFGDDNR